MKVETLARSACGRPAREGSRDRHFGSALTSVSHFWSRRLRSAEEPYLAKS